MDKCVACQFYDRQMAKTTDSKGVQWGQCRRTSPMLHPVVGKSYMIEGVWPHVRDDDWCGEWKVAQRPLQVRPTESVTASPLHAATASSAARSTVLAALQGNGGSVMFPASPAQGPIAVSGRGD